MAWNGLRKIVSFGKAKPAGLCAVACRRGIPDAEPADLPCAGQNLRFWHKLKRVLLPTDNHIIRYQSIIFSLVRWLRQSGP